MPKMPKRLGLDERTVAIAFYDQDGNRTLWSGTVELVEGEVDEGINIPKKKIPKIKKSELWKMAEDAEKHQSGINPKNKGLPYKLGRKAQDSLFEIANSLGLSDEDFEEEIVEGYWNDLVEAIIARMYPDEN